jgi:hypothetical protein
MVVFPTPNPPTITIFSPSLAVLASGTRSEVVESNEHLLNDHEDGGVRQLCPMS